MNRYLAAAVQWKPVVHDARAGAEKACEAIARAAGEGAKLVVFPELWLQGYPYYAGIEIQSEVYQAWRSVYFDAGISVDGPEVALLCQAAKEQGCNLVMGAHLREGGTLYNAQLFIADDGSLLGCHRKLIPTQTERMVHGRGDGSDLEVHATSVGRLGGLLCFEHQMAPARYALCTLNCQVHAACWPGFAFLDGVIDASVRQLAFENGCFVVVAREVLEPGDIPAGMPGVGGHGDHWRMHGGSAIVSPMGEYLAGPVFDEETIVCAEVDYGEASLAKWFMDGAGHYARPDVFRLKWDRRPKPPIEIDG
ncbi:MAG: carbon-nitrogen hydrolase family protein [Gammaproteobacteria bacterium]|nr:carbon-nitrogen hydrolase family protein [Gammaproteobacteria bacterium]